MPFRDSEIRLNLQCGRDPETGRWRGWYEIGVSASALRALGLHPDQPGAHNFGPYPRWP